MEGLVGPALEVDADSDAESAPSDFVGALDVFSTTFVDGVDSCGAGTLEGVFVVEGLGVTGATFAGLGRLTFSLSSPYSFHSSTSSRSCVKTQGPEGSVKGIRTYAYDHPKPDQTWKLSFASSSAP